MERVFLPKPLPGDPEMPDEEAEEARKRTVRQHVRVLCPQQTAHSLDLQWGVTIIHISQKMWLSTPYTPRLGEKENEEAKKRVFCAAASAGLAHSSMFA